MVSSYSISRRIWKWAKKFFFHLLDLTILNSDTVYMSCGGNITCLLFKEQLVRDFILFHKENIEVHCQPRG
jgi:hypothetical protein